MTYREFIEALASETGMSKKATAEFLEVFQGLVTKVVKSGDTVWLPRLGTFSVKKVEGTAFNKKYSSNHCKFKMSSRLRETLNKGKK